MAERKPYFGSQGDTQAGRKPYFGGAHSSPPAPEHKRGGVLGALERLPGSVGSDVVAATTGVLPGLYHVGRAAALDTRDTVTFAAARGHKPKDRLLHEVVVPQGHALAQDVQHPLRHPLFTVLDALAVADLGSTGAARAGLLSRDRAVLETRSPRAIVQDEGPIARRLTENRPLQRGRQRFGHGIAQKTPYTGKTEKGRPVPFSEGTRYGKEIARQGRIAGLKELPAYRSYAKAWQKLNPRERQALNIIPRGVHPNDLAEAWAGTKAGEIAANPKVQELVLNPTPKLQRALAASRALSQQGEELFKTLGYLGEETATNRLGKFHTAISGKLGREAEKLPGQPFYLPDAPMAIRQKDPFAGMGAGKGLPRKPGTAKFNKGYNAALGRIDLSGDVLGHEFTRRVHLKVHSAVSEALRGAAVRLTSDELDRLMHEHGDALPRDWEFLTGPVVSKTGTVRPQKISPIRRLESDVYATPQSLVSKGLGGPSTPLAARVLEHTAFPDELGKVEELQRPVDSQAASESVLAQPFGTRDRNGPAYFDGQHYYIAPRNVIRAAAGEFHRSGTVLRQFVEKPLQVWRAVILGLRVGFFTNNYVGNHLIYAVRTAGIGGMRAYLNSLLAAGKSETLIKRLINEDYVPPGVTQQLMGEFFPEQVEGTFGRTQSPATEGIRGQVGEKASKYKMGIIPATQAAAEGVPRRALVEAMIRDSPEFKTVYKSVPRQARSFDQAARKVLSGKGGVEYQRLISDQVNQALGDYLGLSPVERNAVRNLVPFYSWYKAITTIAYRLAVDHPVRATILSRLGQIGSEDTKRLLGPLPTYLRGVIPVGEREGELQTVLGTGGLNPYATIPQVASGFNENVQNLGLNPFLAGVLEAYARQKRGGDVSGAALAAGFGKGLVAGLPISQIVSPYPPSDLYPKRGRKQTGLGFLGVPLKELNVPEANRRATQP